MVKLQQKISGCSTMDGAEHYLNSALWHLHRQKARPAPHLHRARPMQPDSPVSNRARLTGNPPRPAEAEQSRSPSSLPARDQQAEPDRAPPLQLHLDQLARQATRSATRSSTSLIAFSPTTGSRSTPNSTSGPTPKEVQVTDEELTAVNITRHPFHGEWNEALSNVVDLSK